MPVPRRLVLRTIHVWRVSLLPDLLGLIGAVPGLVLLKPVTSQENQRFDNTVWGMSSRPIVLREVAGHNLLSVNYFLGGSFLGGAVPEPPCGGVGFCWFTGVWFVVGGGAPCAPACTLLGLLSCGFIVLLLGLVLVLWWCGPRATLRRDGFRLVGAVLATLLGLSLHTLPELDAFRLFGFVLRHG